MVVRPFYQGSLLALSFAAAPGTQHLIRKPKLLFGSYVCIEACIT